MPESEVSHDELEAAAAEATGEVAEEAAEGESAETELAEESAGQEETTEEKAEREAEELAEQEKLEKHKEDSALGRKVAAQGEQINALVSSIESLVSSLKPAETAQEEEPDLDEFITRRQARQEARTEFQSLTAEERNAKIKYENAYIDAARGMVGDRTAAEHDAILKEAHANFNIRYSNDGAHDAQLNYLYAENSLLRKGVKVKKNPLKGDTVPVGGATGSETKSKVVSMPTLDEHAAAFVKHHGIKEDEVAEALTGEAPLSLLGKVSA